MILHKGSWHFSLLHQLLVGCKAGGGEGTIGYKFPSASNMVVPASQGHSSLKGHRHSFSSIAQAEGWMDRASGTWGYLGREPGVYITFKFTLNHTLKPFSKKLVGPSFWRTFLRWLGVTSLLYAPPLELIPRPMLTTVVFPLYLFQTQLSLAHLLFC